MNAAQSLCALVVALFASGLAGAAGADDPAAVRGAEIAQTRCAGCHAVALETASPVHDAPLFRVLSRLYAADRLELKLLDLAENGHFYMPRVRLSEDEAADMAAYIASLNGGATQELPRRHPMAAARARGARPLSLAGLQGRAGGLCRPAASAAAPADRWASPWPPSSTERSRFDRGS